MTVETLTNLLYCSFPVMVIVTVVIYVIVNKNKDKPVDTTPPQFYGMRSPTLEEAAEIKRQLAPRTSKPIVVLSLVHASACRLRRWCCYQHARQRRPWCRHHHGLCCGWCIADVYRYGFYASVSDNLSSYKTLQCRRMLFRRCKASCPCESQRNSMRCIPCRYKGCDRNDLGDRPP